MMTVDPLNKILYLCNGQELYSADEYGQNIQLLLDKGPMSGYDDISYSISENAIYAVGMGGDRGAYIYYPGNSMDQSLVMEGYGNEAYLSVTVDNTNDHVYFITSEKLVGTNLSGSSYTEIYSNPPLDYGWILFNRKLNFNEIDEAFFIDGSSYPFGWPYLVIHEKGGLGQELWNQIEVGHLTSSTIKGQIYYYSESDWDDREVVIYMQRFNDFEGRTVHTETDFYDIIGLDVMMDLQSPTVQWLSPSNNQQEVSPVRPSISIAFDEPIQVYNGGSPSSINASIRILRSSDNVQVAQIFRDDPGISIEDNVVTITGDFNLAPNTSYYVWVGQSVFIDGWNNSFSGIGTPTAWRFTTGEENFYSIVDGDWNSTSTWSDIHGGQAIGRIPSSRSRGQIYHQIYSNTDIEAKTLFTHYSTGLSVNNGSSLRITADVEGSLEVRDFFNVSGEIEILGSGTFYLSHALEDPLTIKKMVISSSVSSVVRSNVVFLEEIEGSMPTVDGGSICLAYESNIVDVNVLSQTGDQIEVGWNTGGDQVFVVARASGTTSQDPAFGTMYTANATLGNGEEVSANNFVVYSGTGSSFTLNGLSPNQSYILDVYSFNTSVGGCYSTTNKTQIEVSTCITTAPINIGGNKAVCGLFNPPFFEVSEAPSGYDVVWFTDAVSDDVAAGYYGAGSHVFFPEVSEDGVYNYWAAFADENCVTPRVEAELIVESIEIVGTLSERITCEDEYTIFSETVTLSSNQYIYQWQTASSSSGPFTDIAVNGQSVSYFTTSSGFYRKNVSSVSGACQFVGTTIELLFIDPPTITVDPITPTQACKGENVNLLVSSSFTHPDIRYIWYGDNVNLQEGQNFSNTWSNELTIHDPLQDLSTYHCEVQIGECVQNSDPIILQFLPAITLISQQEPDQVICSNETVSELVGGAVSGGTGAYTYVWEASTSANGTYSVIANATQENYSPSSLASTMYFKRTVESGACAYEGDPIEVAVTPTPVITTQPSDVMICDSGTASFNVVATGSGLGYAWYALNGASETLLSGSPYTGTNTNALSISNPSGLSGQEFFCKVSVNGQCEVNSQTAILQLNDSPIVTPHNVSLCESTAGSNTVTLDLTDYNTSIMGAQNFSLEWYTNAANPVANPTSVITPNNTMYIARVTDPQSTCTSESTLQVLVNGKPTISSVIDKFICHGESTDLTFVSSQPNTQYRWTVINANDVVGALDGQGTTINHTLLNSSNDLKSVVYQVIPSLNNCDGQSFQQIVEVDFSLQDFGLIGDEIYCAGTAGSVLSLNGRQGSVRYDLYLGNVSVAQVNTNSPNTSFGAQSTGTYTVYASTRITVEH